MNPQGTHIQKGNAARNLTRLYIVALTAVALLTISGQILIQTAIRNQLSDSHIVNMAGSQRYKSQSLVKLCLILQADLEHPDYQNKVAELEALRALWHKGHLGLQHGDESLNLPGDNSATVKEMFARLDIYFQNMYTWSGVFAQYRQAMAQERQTQYGLAIKNILANERKFLEGMDQIVKRYAQEASEKVNLLKRIELILFCLTLCILILEGFFVFRPVANRIRQSITKLIESEKNASQLAQKLGIANNSLRQSLKDLKDVNFALDMATIVAKTDRYGIITYVNDKFCEISGFSREELIGSRFDIMSSHYHSRAFFDRMWETISQGRVWNDEIKNKTKTGSDFWLDATIVPILGSNNVPMAYIAIYTDVTLRFKQTVNEQRIRSASIIEGSEKERRKIARELHDGIGQMLTALKFNVESLSPVEDEKEKLESIRQLTQDTITEVRRVSFNLMPSVLNDFGLVPALRLLCEKMSSPVRQVLFDNQDPIERLDKTVEINVYRIVQEALNNAIKYAEATEIKVQIDPKSDQLKLVIEDNGIGFEKSRLVKDGKKDSGNGIVNIQERTRLIDGDFRMETAPGKGTRIFIKIPLPTE